MLWALGVPWPLRLRGELDVLERSRERSDDVPWKSLEVGHVGHETMDEVSCIRTSSELSQLNLLQVSDLLVILVLNLLHYNSQLERAAIAQGPLPVLRRLLLQLAEREPRLCPGLKLKSIQYT